MTNYGKYYTVGEHILYGKGYCTKHVRYVLYRLPILLCVTVTFMSTIQYSNVIVTVLYCNRVLYITVKVTVLYRKCTVL